MIAAVYAILASLANIVGGALVVVRAQERHTANHFLIAFGAGFMLAVAVLEMLPGAMNVRGGLSAVLIGYLAVHVTQHVMTPHFHFGEETHLDAMVSPAVGTWALIGLVPHSFFDGVAISGALLESPELGSLVFMAVLLHKIPTGVSLASIMLASGNTQRQAMTGVTLIGVATVIGAIVTPAIAVLEEYGLALAAGVTIYVAASNLIPESQKLKGPMAPAGLILGIVAFYLTAYLMY